MEQNCFVNVSRSKMHESLKPESNVIEEIPWNWKSNDSLPLSKTVLPYSSQNYYIFGYNLPPVLLNNTVPTIMESSNDIRANVFKKISSTPRVNYSDDSSDNVDDSDDTNRFSDSNMKYHPSTLLEVELDTSEPSIMQPVLGFKPGDTFSKSSMPASTNAKYSFNEGYRFSSKETFKCTICDKECIDRESLDLHLVVHAQRCKIRKCDYCDQTFSSKGKWHTHFKTHFNDSSFDCMFCSSVFVKENYLLEHLKVHSSREALPTCDIPSIQPKEEKHYPCTFCGKDFPDRSSILFHLRIHTSDIIFRCMYCSKMFLNRSELNLHVRVHTGEKTHVCEICQKTFLTTSNLKQHIRTHTGDRPYCCTSCDKTFSNKSNLVQHTKVHTGEKPFKCKFCEKSFTTTSNLTQHLRTHTGVKPYICSVCNKAFINNSNLSQHKKVHGIESKKDDCKSIHTRPSNSNAKDRP